MSKLANQIMAQTFGKDPLKLQVQRIVSEATKRINKETDPDKKYRLKFIKQELSKLADEL